MTDPATYPTLTAELLKFTTPIDAKHWRVEKLIDDVWRIQSHSFSHTTGGSRRKYFDISDGTLTLETFQARWGDGVYRINWCSHTQRVASTSRPFFVAPADPNAIAEAPSVVRGSPSPSAHEQGNGARSNGGAVFLPGTPTAQKSPPLSPTPYPEFVGTRDASPLELYLAIREQCLTELEMHRAYEERRSKEHRAEMELRMLQITKDAEVRIAEAQARASFDRDRVHEQGTEVTQLRALLLQAAKSENRDELDPNMLEALDEMSARLDAIDDEEEPNVMAQMIGGIIQKFIPVLTHALANKLEVPGAVLEGASTMADTIAEVTGGEGS